MAETASKNSASKATAPDFTASPSVTSSAPRTTRTNTMSAITMTIDSRTTAVGTARLEITVSCSPLHIATSV
jgi:hypothetical protein